MHPYEKALCPRCWTHAVAHDVCQSCGRRLPEKVADGELGEFIDQVDHDALEDVDDRSVGGRTPWISTRNASDMH